LVRLVPVGLHETDVDQVEHVGHEERLNLEPVDVRVLDEKDDEEESAQTEYHVVN